MEYALPNIKKPKNGFFLFLYIIEMPPTTRSKSKLESEEKKIKEQQFTDYFVELNDDKIQKWLENPTKNPIDNSPIDNDYFNSTNKYFRIYNAVFKYYRKQGLLNDDEILRKMPSNHKLFNNKYDYLYYDFFMKNPIKIHKDAEKMLKFLYDYLSEDNLKGKSYDVYCKNIIIEKFVKQIYICIEYIEEELILLLELGFSRNSDEYKSFTIETYDDYKYINMLINSFEINDIIDEEIYERLIDGMPGFMFSNYIREMRITPDKIIHYYDTLFQDIIKLHTGKVIQNNENKKYEELEDPLIRILSDFSSNNPDFDIENINTELPKRAFENIDDFEKFKNEYEEKNKKYNDAKAKYNKWESEEREDTEPEFPKRETILFNKKPIIVGTRPDLLKFINDEDYEKLKEKHKSNLKILNEYQKLMNLDFFTLTKKPPSEKLKTRKQINKKYLENGDGNPKKCNGNFDTISSENFDSEYYPLTKLQLMVKIHTRNNENKITRTDCFYTPNIYNYLVSIAKEGVKSFTNPNRPDILLTEENLREIMRKVKLIDPTKELPKHIVPRKDTEFYLLTRQNGLFYNIYLSRKFTSVPEFIIYKICCIPANIEQTHTGSSDMTSATMIIKIQNLFDKGLLLHSYVPPYKNEQRTSYIKLGIHFNRYKEVRDWGPLQRINEEPSAEKIRLFKHYFQEISSYE